MKGGSQVSSLAGLFCFLAPLDRDLPKSDMAKKGIPKYGMDDYKIQIEMTNDKALRIAFFPVWLQNHNSLFVWLSCIDWYIIGS